TRFASGASPANLPALIWGQKERKASGSFCRHTPPPGLAFGEPDDRLQRGIQYAAASRFHHNCSGIPDHPLSRMMTPWYEVKSEVHFRPLQTEAIRNRRTHQE